MEFLGACPTSGSAIEESGGGQVELNRFECTRSTPFDRNEKWNIDHFERRVVGFPSCRNRDTCTKNIDHFNFLHYPITPKLEMCYRIQYKTDFFGFQKNSKMINILCTRVHVGTHVGHRKKMVRWSDTLAKSLY